VEIVSETKTVPEIRFTGFTDAWVLRKLGEVISNLKSGLSRMLSNEDIGLPVVRANNIVDGKLDMENDVKYWYTLDPQGAQISNYFIHKDDVLINFINSESRMGTSTIVIEPPTRDTIYTTNILNLRTNQHSNPYYIYTLTFTKKYRDYISAITKPAVSQASFTTVDFRNYEFRCPCVYEQTAISNFFRTLDNTITLYKRKLDGLKQLKKAYLQQMFPKDCETTPRIRFAMFTEPWIVQLLGDLAEFNPRSTLPDTFEYVDLESVVGTTLIFSRTEIRETAPSRAQRLARRGDVFFQTVRPYQMNNYLYDLPHDNFVFSTGYAQLRPKTHSYFLLCKLQEEGFVAKVINRCTGTSYPTINSTDLAEIEVMIADVKEQAIIGGFFRTLDENIAKQQTNLDNMTQLKSAYLQKMFI